VPHSSYAQVDTDKDFIVKFDQLDLKGGVLATDISNYYTQSGKLRIHFYVPNRATNLVATMENIKSDYRAFENYTVGTKGLDDNRQKYIDFDISGALEGGYSFKFMVMSFGSRGGIDIQHISSDKYLTIKNKKMPPDKPKLFTKKITKKTKTIKGKTTANAKVSLYIGKSKKAVKTVIANKSGEFKFRNMNKVLKKYKKGTKIKFIATLDKQKSKPLTKKMK